MKNKLKIGVVIDQLVPGGVQKTAIQEAKNLIKSGHEVILFVLVRLHYEYQYQDLSKGLKVIFLSDYNPWPFRRAIRIPYFGFLTHLHILNPLFVSRYHPIKNLDFLISHGTTTCITVSAISRKLKIPYMAFIHDPMIYILDKVYGQKPICLLFPVIKPLTRFYERSFLTTAALVITQSNVHKEFIKRVYHVSPTVIHPGCIPPQTIPPKTDSYILGYSRWEMAKNPQLFLWLAKKLPQARFLIAGSWSKPNEKYQFQELIKNDHLTDRIKLLSPVDEEDLKKIAGQSLVWVHPHFEAFGMAGLEMASLGLPLIAPEGSGVTELFQEEKHGFFPSSRNKKRYLEHLIFLLDNPEKARQMGKKASEVARSSTWEKHAQAVIEVIKTYLGQTKIVCLANAFVSILSTGGGDHFIIELSRRVPKNIHLTIILPSVGLYHWQRAKISSDNIRFLVLRSSIFDNKDSPISLFCAYLIRTIQTYRLIPKLPPFQILHTATDLTPDAVPAYLYHRTHKSMPWLARFFHFFESPFRRKGRLWVNIGSWLLQQLSLGLLKEADIIMIDNANLREGFESRGINQKKIELHSGGVSNEDIIRIKPQASFSSDALFIGRLQPHKGVFDAIDVWKKVVEIKPSAKLIMIGYGQPEIMEKLNKEITSAGLEKNIYFTGHIHEREKLACYCRSSKLLLFLDHEAGFGLVIAEAMAAGLPVVAYNLPIFGAAYKKGFLISPLKDTSSFSNHVLDLLTHPEKREAISQLAKEEAKRFDWSHAAKKFYHSFAQLPK